MRYLLPCAFVIILGLSSCGDEINIFKGHKTKRI